MVDYILEGCQIICVLGIIAVVGCAVNLLMRFIDNIPIEEVKDTPLYITKEIYLD